jgi:hypothetical protein
MGRLRAVLATVALVASLSACADDDVEVELPDPAPAPELVPELAIQRFRAVCAQTLTGEALDRCRDLAEPTVAAADEAGCPDASIDAYLEHGVAWRFESAPDEGFFEHCPRPLSNMVPADPPEGFDDERPGGYAIGLLATSDVAADFGDAEGVGRWLTELGHQVSYQTAWRRDDADVLVVRIDRFASPDGARVLADPEGGWFGADEQREVRTVAGVLDGRITTVEFDVDDPRPRHQAIAMGRVCEVAFSVHAMAEDAPIEPEVIRNGFTRLAARAQATTEC